MKNRLPSFYHITHIENLPSISIEGILSLREIHHRGLKFKDLSNASVQQRRNKVESVYNRCLHEYVPAYFNPRNPFQYAQLELNWDRLAILEISTDVLTNRWYDFVISDGNAASQDTHYFGDIRSIKKLPWIILNKNKVYWLNELDGKRRICSECLVYPMIKKNHILKIHFRNPGQTVEFSGFGFPMANTPSLFF
jgi:hypothetical protein